MRHGVVAAARVPPEPAAEDGGGAVDGRDGGELGDGHASPRVVGMRRCAPASGTGPVGARGPGSAVEADGAADAQQIDVTAGGEQGGAQRCTALSAGDRFEAPHDFLPVH
ncbi:hypothetical protein GCM10010260_51810 [Streptomyces filipinensis]|uniref:Uncharacterized protein n=1 Tax=Streptomyces filipinensis TaxID=66887 RepID=A0A918IEG2_9ACTN|nr:hypothetical protein GCM10010260_51810 [Streptomyces filipinensis]